MMDGAAPVVTGIGVMRAEEPGGGIRDEELARSSATGKSRGVERASNILLASAGAALADARWPTGNPWADRLGVAVGSRWSTFEDLVRYDEELIREGPGWLNPGDWPRISPSAPSSRLSIRFGARGPSATFTSGAPAFAEAVCAGAGWLALGRCDAVLAGGVETVSLARRAWLENGGRAAGRPLGEAGVVIVMEREAGAAARGIRPLCRVAGCGFAAGEGAARRAVAACLERAGGGAVGLAMAEGCREEVEDALDAAAVPVNPLEEPDRADYGGAAVALQCARAVEFFNTGGRGAALALCRDHGTGTAGALLLSRAT